MDMGIYGYIVRDGQEYSILALSSLASLLTGRYCTREMAKIESGLSRKAAAFEKYERKHHRKRMPKAGRR